MSSEDRSATYVPIAPIDAIVDLPAFTPEAAERIAAAAHLDMGGIEYIVDDRDGALMYYDINALSNFVADAPRILGFDPHARLVDYLVEEADKCATGIGSQSSVAG